jgi:hypothetical protein
VKNLRKIGHFEICFLSIYIPTSIDRFLIRMRVKYPETLKGNNFIFLDQIFLNLTQYFRIDERTIVPILSKFRHFSKVTPVHP